MALSVEIGEVFVLVLVLAGYVPVVRAYARQRRARWFLLGYTALLAGRAATIAEDFVASGLWVVAEHGVGVALAGVCFFLHFTAVSRDRRTDRRGDRDARSPEG